MQGTEKNSSRNNKKTQQKSDKTFPLLTHSFSRSMDTAGPRLIESALCVCFCGHKRSLKPPQQMGMCVCVHANGCNETTKGRRSIDQPKGAKGANCVRKLEARILLLFADGGRTHRSGTSACMHHHLQCLLRLQ